MNELQKLTGIPPSQLNGLNDRREMNIDDVAAEFERLFARQMVEQMTRSLFENDGDSGLMKSGESMYKDQVVDILSKELGQHEALGIGDIIRDFWNRRNEPNEN